MPGAAVWRIARRPHALDRLGTGARQAGGRWNLAGTAVISAGETIAVAALETFVHLAGVVPADLVLVRIDLPGDHSFERPGLDDLPAEGDAVPTGSGSMEFGPRWARDGRSLVLYVPSVLVREERNAVVNPGHPEFAGVSFVIERDFQYDPRMFGPRAASTLS